MLCGSAVAGPSPVYLMGPTYLYLSIMYLMDVFHFLPVTVNMKMWQHLALDKLSTRWTLFPMKSWTNLMTASSLDVSELSSMSVVNAMRLSSGLSIASR